MVCEACGRRNREGAAFCDACGEALSNTASLARVHAPDHLVRRILRARASVEGERKQVTVMFVDIVRSMELAGSLGTERWRWVLDRFFALTCHAVHAVEGTVHQFTGDGVMVVFGAPVAHEDHARRACLAALDLHEKLEPFAAQIGHDDDIELQVRCGVNSGEVIVGSIGDDLQMEYTTIGNTNGLAKRLESLARAGSTALSSSTAALVEGEFAVRDLGTFAIKGMREPQRVLELVGPGAARTRLEAAEARGLPHFVGRGREQATLERALERALAGDGRAVAIRGEPGVGKSRLCREFVREHADGCVVNSTSAVAHGRRVPFLSALAILREVLEVGERDEPDVARHRIATVLIDLDPSFEADLALILDFLGVSDPERPFERIDPEARQRRLLGLVGRLVRARSERRPVILVIEDLHWLDGASAAFLEELARAVADTRTLLLTTFRPEYEAAWIRSRHCDGVTLRPLDSQAMRELLEELLGTHPSIDGLAELVAERAAGNPFFAEEIVRALVETEHLAGERSAHRLARPVADLILPPTVHAVLAARIDRLGHDEKSLVQTMAVIGKEVPESVLSDVSDMSETELAPVIGKLIAADFVTPTATGSPAEYEFRHPLTQEVAYASQLSDRRARAHAAVSVAIQRIFPDGLDERAALLAHHTEAAGETLEAARWHARAAAWAGVSAPAEGMRHWRRVRDLTDLLAASPEVEGLATAARIWILALAWRVGMPEPDVASTYAEAVAIAGAEEPGFNGALLETAYAVNLFATGREVQSLDHFRSASQRAQAIGDAGLALSVNAPAALAACLTGSLGEERELANRALALAGDDVVAGAGLMLGNPYSHCLWLRGHATAYLGRLDRGLAEMANAVSLAREHGDEESESYALGARIILLTQVGDLETVLEDGDRAAELAERSGGETMRIFTAATQAMGRVACHEHDGARASAERALATLRRKRVNLLMEPYALTALGLAQLGLGRPADALAAIRDGAATARRRGLRPFEILAGIALARVLIADEAADLGAAGAALASALQRAREIGARISEPEIHIQLASLARQRGEPAAERRALGEARRVLAQIGASTVLSEASLEHDRAVAAHRGAR